MIFKTIKLFILLAIMPMAGITQFHEDIFPEKEGPELLDELVQFYKPVNVLGYGPARDTLYATIYFYDDSVRCVYSGHSVFLPPGVDPSVALFMNGSNNGINTEHTFPRSKGADEANGNPYSDMHHIYPSKTPVNAARADFPFAEISDNETDAWYYLSQTLNTIPTSNIDLYSEGVEGFFEPREDHKGNVARAMFYFYTMYKQEADDADPVFFESQRETLCDWHYLDPVDNMEWARTFMIAQHQDGKPNPFVLDCSLPFRSYCSQISMECQDLLNTSTFEEPAILNDFKIFPNPAKELANISFVLDTDAHVHLSVYDVLGREVQIIANDTYYKGAYSMKFHLSDPGMYFCRILIRAGSQTFISHRKFLFE